MPRPCSSSGGPVHRLVDSTGLRLRGPGAWLIEKHGTRRRRDWRKLPIGVDAETRQILASELTTGDVDDGSQVTSLLDQITAPLACFIGDGAYDQEGVYNTVAARHPDADVIIPPRSTAVASEDGETAPTQRDRHLHSIAEQGLAEAVRVHASGFGGGRHPPLQTSDRERLTLATGSAPQDGGRHRR